jgi:hypothetical protein
LVAVFMKVAIAYWRGDRRGDWLAGIPHHGTCAPKESDS